MPPASEVDLVRGTLDLIILRTLRWGPKHGLGIARWLEEVTRQQLIVEEGALYPALHRLEQKKLVIGEWGYTDAQRRARFYRLTEKGKRHLAAEVTRWTRYTQVMERILTVEVG